MIECIVGLVVLIVALTVLVTWRDRRHRGVRGAHERATTGQPTQSSTALGWSDGSSRLPGRSSGY